MLLQLSTGQKLGLALVAGVFIVFSLASALLVPRYRPGFPGRRGLPFFVVVSAVFFVAMLGAVEVLAREGEEGPERETPAREASPGAVTSSEDENEPTTTEQNAPATTSPGPGAKTIAVSGTEFDFGLSNANLSAGNYVFELKNTGKVPHNLVVSGPEVDNASTPVIGPGETARLRVALVSGTYKFYCSVPGHEDGGMKGDLTVK